MNWNSVTELVRKIAQGIAKTSKNYEEFAVQKLTELDKLNSMSSTQLRLARNGLSLNTEIKSQVV